MALKRRLGRADRGRLRVGVDDARHGLVVGLARLAEDVRGDDLALVLADVGQRPDAVDVADRPEALARAQARVDRDPVRVGLDADRLQADPLDPRAAAGGDEQAVAAQLAAVLELEDVVVAVAPRGASRARRGRARCLRGAGPRRAPRRAAPARGRAGARRPRRAPPRRRGGAPPAPSRRRPGPPPSTSSRRGTAFIPVTSRLVQTPSSSRRPGIGRHDRVGARRRRRRARRCGGRRRPRPRPVPASRPCAAQQVDAVRRRASAPGRRRSSRRP